MIDVLLSLTLALFKALALAAASYLFYWKVFDYTHAVYFYRKQGDNVCKLGWFHLPLVGNVFLILWSAWKSYRENDNYFIMKHGFDDATKDTDVGILWLSKDCGIGIKDVKVVEAMYTGKNKYFDKHPLVKDLAKCLTGDSILFAETSDDWRKSRKAISPAFYKGKLENLVEIAKQAVDTTLTRFKSIAS